MPGVNPVQVPRGLVGTAAAVRITGMHQRTFSRWIRRGALQPRLLRGSPGSKHAAYAWSPRELVAARAAVELQAAGMAPQRARSAAVAIMASRVDLETAKLWSPGGLRFEVVPPRRLSRVLQPGRNELYSITKPLAHVRRALAAEARASRRRNGPSHAK